MTTLLAATFLLVQLLSQLLATVECGSTCELPSGYESYPGDNTAIKIYTERVTWEEARERCVSDGAHLAVAITREKIQFIQNRGSYLWVWIGINRLNYTSGWIRIDTGLPVSSPLPWRDNDRDDDVGCAATVLSEGRITNAFCGYPWPFACEISLAEDRCPDPPSAFQGPQGTVVSIATA